MNADAPHEDAAAPAGRWAWLQSAVNRFRAHGGTGHLLVWFATFVFSAKLYDLVGSILWFPPAWRRMSLFLLVFIGSVTFNVLRKQMTLRQEDLDEEKHSPREMRSEQRVQIRRAAKFAIAFLSFVCAYILLFHKCVVAFDPDDEPSSAHAGAAGATEGRPSTTAVERDPWSEEKYFYLPVVLPKDIGDYCENEHGMDVVLEKNHAAVRARLDTTYSLRMGVTTTLFLVVYGGMVVSLAGTFAYSFSPVEATAESVAERLRS